MFTFMCPLLLSVPFVSLAPAWLCSSSFPFVLVLVFRFPDGAPFSFLYFFSNLTLHFSFFRGKLYRFVYLRDVCLVDDDHDSAKLSNID